MTRIENDLGVFEAETEAEALKKARAAKRHAKKAEKQREESLRMARLYACEAGFQLHERLAEVRTGEQKTLPRGWRWLAPGQSYCPVKVLPDERAALGGHVATYEMPHTRVRVEHHGYRITGVLVNGAGYPLAVVIDDVEPGRPTYVYALGADDGVLALQSLTVDVAELRAMLAGRGE